MLRSPSAHLLVLAMLVLAMLVACGTTDAPAPTAPPPTIETPELDDDGDGPSDPDEDDEADERGDDEDDDDDEVAAPDLGAHEVVVVAVHDDPLLRSEQRLLDVIAERMRMRRLDAIQRAATEEESTFARAFFGGEAARPSARPSSLAEVGTVVFLRFPPNRELDRGDRGTRGLGGVLAFRRGDAEPFLELRIDDSSAWRAPDEQIWPWLISLVRAQGAS